MSTIKLNNMKKYLLSIAFLLSFMALMAQQLPSELNKGLVFHAPLNEWFPTKDLVSGTNGTATAVYNVADRQGSGANRHFEYDGVNDYVDCGTSTSLNPGTGNWSLITRIKTTSTSTQGIYTCTDGTTNDVVYLRMEASGALRGRWEDNGVAKQVLTSTTYNDGSWHSICFKVDRTSATGMKIIVDNVEASYTTQDDPTSLTGSVSPTGTKYLGIWFDGSAYPFSGSISLVRIFNYALTPTQIANYSKPEYPIEWVDRISGTIGANLISSTITNGDFTTFSGASASGFTAASASGGYATTADELVYYIGKYYNVNYSLTVNSGSTPRYSFFDTTGGSGQDAAWITMTAGGKSDRVLITNSATANTGCLFFQTLSASNFVVSGLSITQAGCVLDLNSSGLSRASDGSYNTGYWTDRTNQNSAQVVGATSVIPPASNLNASWFNGTTSNILTNSYVTLGNFTVSLWCNLNKTSIDQSFITRDTYSHLEFRIDYTSSNNIDVSVFGNDGANYMSWTHPVTINANSWYNIIVTVNQTASTIKVYKDGSEVSGSTYNNSFTSMLNNLPLVIGCINRPTKIFYLNGLLSNIIVWNRILSSDEISLINQLGH